MTNKKQKSAIDAITDHFDNLITRSIVVPEWGDLEIFVTAMTIRQRNNIYKDKNGVIDLSVMVDAVILKSLDEDGTRLFSKMDRSKLSNQADDTIISRVASFILEVPEDQDDEIEKN